jgi:DNA-binding MarR family transcriptional regulator
MSKKTPKTNKKNLLKKQNKKEKNTNSTNITKNNIQNNQELINGLSYYTINEENESILNLIKKLVEQHNYKTLSITRSNSDYINNALKSKKIKTEILKQKNLNEIIQKINNFSKQNTKSVILLDRIDYLISNYSFNQFIKYLYNITEINSENKSIFILNINTSSLDEKQLSLIKSELLPIPGKNLDEIQIKSDYYEILKLINKYYKNNVVVEFKKISDDLSINRKTLSKRINNLAKQKLINIIKSGRSKIPYLTDKAKSILNKNL